MRDILGQCHAIRKEISDCHQRIEKLQQEIDGLETVADTVTGTRKNGTIGPITIHGYPDLLYRKKLASLLQSKEQVEEWTQKLLDKQVEAERFIESVEESDTRTMLRLYSDLNNWRKVAKRMNKLFPERRVPYTEDSCRMRYLRLLKGGEPVGKI